MTMADVIVEIGFSGPETGTYLHLDDPVRGLLDTGTLAPDDLWTDVTEYVVSVSTRRGATRADGPTLRYEAGTATIVLRNEDRRFDPTNLDGPYASGGATQVVPMRAVRIRATYGGVTYALWRGFADNWQVAYEGVHASTVTLTASDAFKVFASFDRGAVAAVGSGESSGARINRVLDSIDWPDGDRIVDVGDVTLQATTLADNTLSELLLTADSELGEFYMDAQGHAVFRRRLGIQEEDRSIYPAACFGTEPTGEDTTVNLFTNPSAETNLDGILAGGFVAPTVTRSNTRALFGTWSVLATWPTASSSDLPLVQYTVSGLTVGRAYTFSIHAYAPTGSPSVSCILATTGPWGTSTGSTKDAWVRISLTTAVVSETVLFQIWPFNSTTTSGQQVFLDGMQVEEGDTATPYVDGDQSGCEWDGVAHTSTSRRLPELPYADVAISYDDQSIYNRITIGRVGGTEQTAESTASRDAYLTRTFGRSDLLLQTDTESLRYAEQLIARHALPELRFSTLTLNPRTSGYEDALYGQALGREIGDRIRIVQRPPGGGDPITRDVWVRGIEHQFSKEQDWRTAFVLQQAPDVGVVSSTFDTAAATGWSNTDTGEVWAVTGGASSAFAVAGGSARHIHSSVNNNLRSFVEAYSPNVRTVVDFINPVQPTGAPITLRLVARAADVNNYYAALVSISTANVLTLSAVKVVANAFTSLASAGVGTTTGAQTWRVVLETVGTLLRAKAWRPGVDAEPGWQAFANDSALTAGTQCGLITRLEPGNTSTLPHTIFFTGYESTTLHAWT